MLSNQAKKQIMETLLSVIHNISDEEYQKRVWIKAEGPECDDFDETCNYFFGEISDILENYKAFEITNEQYRHLIKFYAEFRVFADNNDFPEEFIETPEWDRIMNLAKSVLKAFDYQKK